MKSSIPTFRFRSFVSVVLALGFVALLISGSVLFLAPPGRVANWTNWQILGLTKHGWGNLHVTFSALFLLAGLAHLILNVRPMLHHVGARLAGGARLRPEWIAALGVSLVVLVGTQSRIPPFSHLLAWSESLRESWSEDRARAPIPHAELLSLRELAAQAGVPVDAAMQRLRDAGWAVADADTRVQEIADGAGIPPAKVYERLQARQEGGGKAEAVPNGGPDHPRRGPGAGGGPGQKTLGQFCAGESLDIGVVRSRLVARGIRFEESQTLREIAVANGYDRPYGLLEIIRQK